MQSKKSNKATSENDEDAGVRRSSRNKARLKDHDSHTEESEISPLHPSPPSRNLRSKYCRKPLHEYVETSPLSQKPKQDISEEDYTRFLKPNESDVDNGTNFKKISNGEYPFIINDEGRKISVIPHIENVPIDNPMSPPIGTCKTSSPVNSTEIFDAPASAIVGPAIRATRFNSQSSTNSHDESYISTRSERRTRNNNNSLPGDPTSVRNDASTDFDEDVQQLTYSKSQKTSIHSKVDLSVARERHENIKRYYQQKEENNQEWNATWLNSCGIVVTSVVIVVIALLFGSWKNNTASLPSRVDPTKELIRSLKKQFPSQTEDTWKVLGSNIKRINNQRSNQAACIVFVGPASEIDDKGILKCIASVVAKEISNMKGVKPTPMTQFSLSNLTVDSDHFRNDRTGLHNAVENSLSANSAVALFDINHLSGSSAMALHSFCDSDPTGGQNSAMAPYVNTAVLATLKVKNNEDKSEIGIKGESNKMAHTYVEQELTSAWKFDIGEDKAASLISRVALNAVFLHPESSTVTNTICL